MTSKGSFAAKKAKKLFKKRQNDEGAKQHMAPSTSQAAWTFVRVALSNRSKIDGRKDTPNFFISSGLTTTFGCLFGFVHKKKPTYLERFIREESSQRAPPYFVDGGSIN